MHICKKQENTMKILDRITRAVDAQEDHLKILLWGSNGSGKSTLCGTAPAPILYAYTERQGLLSFKRLAPKEDCVKIESLQDLRFLLKELSEGTHKYSTICLDSFTEMQQLIIDELIAKKTRSHDDVVELFIKDRLWIHEKTKSLVRSFRDLRMNVVLTCLSETVVIGDGDKAKSITRVMLSGQKLPPQMGQFFNLIGFVYKGSNEGRSRHRVLFDGRTDLDTKGMPGLRRREDPDISYWHEVVIRNKQAREGELIPPISRGEE